MQPPETEHHPVREAVMPVIGNRTGIAGRTRAVALLGVATAVVAIYVALPLVLVFNDLLHDLLSAVAATGGLVALVVTGIATVLARTTSKVQAIPEVGDMDPRRESRTPRYMATRHAAPRHAAPRHARSVPTAAPASRAQAGRGAHRWVADGNRAA